MDILQSIQSQGKAIAQGASVWEQTTTVPQIKALLENLDDAKVLSGLQRLMVVRARRPASAYTRLSHAKLPPSLALDRAPHPPSPFHCSVLHVRAAACASGSVQIGLSVTLSAPAPPPPPLLAPLFVSFLHIRNFGFLLSC